MEELERHGEDHKVVAHVPRATGHAVGTLLGHCQEHSQWNHNYFHLLTSLSLCLSASLSLCLSVSLCMHMQQPYTVLGNSQEHSRSCPTYKSAYMHTHTSTYIHTHAQINVHTYTNHLGRAQWVHGGLTLSYPNRDSPHNAAAEACCARAPSPPMCLNVYTCTEMFVYNICICIHIYTYIYIYLYTHTHKLSLSL